MAVRHAGTFQAAATEGAAEKRARRRKEAFAIETGRGAKKVRAGMRYATFQTARARQAMPNRIEPLNTAKAAVAYLRTMGRYSVAIVIWRKHHSVHVARSAPSNVGTSAAGTYAIFSPASRTACVRMRSSLNTSCHRSSSRKGTRRSFRIAHDDQDSVARIHLGQQSAHVFVEARIEPANGEYDRDGWQECTEGQAHGPSHATAEPDSLDDRCDAREERQDREKCQPNPKKVQRHRRANLRVRNKPWRLRTDEDVVAFDTHLERPETGHRVRKVCAGPHIVFPSVVRARDHRVVEHALPDRSAAVEAHIRDRVESPLYIEEGDGMALNDDDASLPLVNVRRLRDPNEGGQQDPRAATDPGTFAM